MAKLMEPADSSEIQITAGPRYRLVHSLLLCLNSSFNVQFLQVQSNYISGVFSSSKVFLSVVFLSTALEKHDTKI